MDAFVVLRWTVVLCQCGADDLSCGPASGPGARQLRFASLLDPLIERLQTPASTAAITSTAASSSSSVIPAFLASARRRSTHGSQSRIIATVRPMSIFSCSVEQFRDARTRVAARFRMSDVFSAFAPSFCYASCLSSHAQRTAPQERYRHRSAKRVFPLR